MRRSFPLLLLAAALFFGPGPAFAHPTPFSYFDLRLSSKGVVGTVVVHNFDAAADLADVLPEELTKPAVAEESRDPLIRLLTPRIRLTLDGRSAEIVWGAIETVPERNALRLSFRVEGDRPTRVHLKGLLFTYDPGHQTFVNIYEDTALAHQAILDRDHTTTEYYSGTLQGRLSVVRTFVVSGIEHILIGPDHVLFLIGLLLLRGSLGRLALIVTAFTIGHSVTLSLAALDIVSPPSRLIEPLIALTIIVVGADNLLVLKAASDLTKRTTDIRAGLAAGFGLIHGFGFASVLKEFGLPQGALGWSLFAFNLGVEIGQLAIVVVVASSLAWLHRRSPGASARIARGGSVAVILAGSYWFVQRTFFPGG